LIAITENEPAKPGLAASQATAPDPVIYYSESAFQDYDFENSRFSPLAGGHEEIQGVGPGRCPCALAMKGEKRQESHLGSHAQ
jgi:hypothetical protein